MACLFLYVVVNPKLLIKFDFLEPRGTALQEWGVGGNGIRVFQAGTVTESIRKLINSSEAIYI
jgi:hypothetical protein